MKVPRFAIVLVPLCAGVGFLALFAASRTPHTPAPLPPPFFSTRSAPSLALQNMPVSTPLADSPAITLADSPYRHPSGAFTVAYPADWQLDESEDSAQFTAPDGIGEFSVTFETGQAAAHADYEAGLRSTWGDLAMFAIEQVDSAGLPDRWRATFSFELTRLPDRNRVKALGLVIQRPHGEVLYTFTALQQADDQTLGPILHSIAGSLQTDPDAAMGNSE